MSTVVKKIVKKSLDLLKKEKKKHKVGTWLANSIYKKKKKKKKNYVIKVT